MGTQNAPFFALVRNLLSKLKNSINENPKSSSGPWFDFRSTKTDLITTMNRPWISKSTKNNKYRGFGPGVRLGQFMLGNIFSRRKVVKQTMTKMTCDFGYLLDSFLNSLHRIGIVWIIVLDSWQAQSLSLNASKVEKKCKNPRTWSNG